MDLFFIVARGGDILNNDAIVKPFDGMIKLLA